MTASFVMGQKLRRIFSNRLLQMTLVTLAAFAGFWGGHKIDKVIERQLVFNQLDHDGQQLLGRLELVVEQSHAELKKLSKMKLEACGADALKAARMTVLSRGVLKLIDVRDKMGTLQCSTTIGNTGDFSSSALHRASELADTKNEIFVGIAENKLDGLLQLRKDLENHHSAIAYVGLDSLLYFFFDPGIRSSASVGIYFDKSKPVATYGEIQSIRKEAGGFESNLQSARFPLSVRMSVPEKSIQFMAAQHQSVTEWRLAVAACLLAALGMILAVNLGIRPPNPVKELSAAIHRDEIVPFYQPIMKLADESVSGCEMLVRWIKPDGTMIRPDLFIPLAETSGLVVDMTMRIMRRAIRELMPVFRVQKDFKLAINISADHFSAPGFLPSILTLLKEEKLEPSHIVLELTERQQLQDLQAFLPIAEAVRAAGLRISIDDVGTGHNGLSTIQDVPANIIKIDKKFVDTIASNELSAAIVALLTGLSKKFDRVTVAEGIETRDQLEALKAQSVDEGQGYLFSPAIDALKFIAFYGAHQKSGQMKWPNRKPKLKAAA